MRVQVSRKWFVNVVIAGALFAAIAPGVSAQSGPIFLTQTPELSETGETFIIQLPVVNNGTATAAEVTVTSATLGSAAPTSPALPLVLGTMAPGDTNQLVLQFSRSEITLGRNYLLVLRGTYHFGTATLGFVVNRFVLAALQSPYTGRLVANTTILLPPGSAAHLSAAQQELFHDEGFQIDDEHDTLIGQQSGLAGYWVKIVGHDGWFMTDRNGNFRIPELPTDAATLAFYQQLSDTDPEVTFPLNRVGSPPVYTLEIKLPIPGEMNEQPVLGSSFLGELPNKGPDACSQLGSPPGCKPQAGKCVVDTDSCECRCNADSAAAKANAGPPGCCQDYNGPLGDKLPRSRHSSSAECVRTAELRNFPGSTCFVWSTNLRRNRPCHKEVAYQCAPPLLLTHFKECAEKQFNTCWIEHKYRNCQNMNEDDFSISPHHNIKIPPKSTLKMHVRNNTAANETEVSVSNGNLRLATSGPVLLSFGKGNFNLEHYSNPQKKHYEDVDLVFTAPTLPPGVCSETVVFNAKGGGFDLSANIRVVDPNPNCTCPPSALQLGFLSDTQQCPTPSVLGTVIPDVDCNPQDNGLHSHSLVLVFFNDKITCQEWDLNSCALIANQKWLAVTMSNIGPESQPPIGPGTYTLGTLPGPAGGQSINAIPFTTDAKCDLSGHENQESGTITLNSITSTSIQGHIDAVVNGVPYIGDFTASLCAPPRNPCAQGCTGPVTCLPGPIAALRSQQNCPHPE
jgi:hypothetical protein